MSQSSRNSTSTDDLHGRLERTLALTVAFTVAIRYSLPPGVPVGYLIAAMLLPICMPSLRQFKGGGVIVVLSISAVVSGAFLSIWPSSMNLVSESLLVGYSWRVCGIALLIIVLLWVRSIVGNRLLIFMFALGTLASIAFNGINFDNPWKFTFSVPVILLTLSLPGVYGKRFPQTLVLVALALVSALNDSRSAAALLVIAAAITFTQSRRQGSVVTAQKRAFTIGLRMAALAVGGYFLVQAAILEGMLGEGAQSRTEMQIQQSGSALVGGRPEMGAAISLISARPWGYGSGTLASYEYINRGKEGMAALGYDPNNGYVEKYMFGNGLEVHSLVGDMWLSYGIAGLLLAIALVAYALYGTVLKMASGAATGAVIYLALRLVWDFAFSPYGSAMLTLPLAVAVALPCRMLGSRSLDRLTTLNRPTDVHPPSSVLRG